MTLSVHAYRRNEAGEMEFIEPSDGSQDVAGFESFRKTFYGGNMARLFGLRLLPSLAESNVFAEGNDLAALHNEATIIMQNLEQFAPEAKADVATLRFRVQNILGAVNRAQQAHGGVVIW
ncbi:MAG: hypothetical protein WCJ09_24585 [Planctomycetota bacterium]